MIPTSAPVLALAAQWDIDLDVVRKQAEEAGKGRKKAVPA